MNEVVNLRQFRKARARADKAREADANRVKFGRTKEERKLDEVEKRKMDKMLESVRIGEDNR